MPVSSPFFSASAQPAVLHTLPAQTPLLQSDPVEQLRPLSQVGQPPPQSTSVSFPFFFESVQLAAPHTLPTQLMLVQSLAALHI
jgi:hypothetical protein